jgi:hypothetical protein
MSRGGSHATLDDLLVDFSRGAPTAHLDPAAHPR